MTIADQLNDPQFVPACVGSCRLCSQGRLLVAKDLSSGVRFVFCEECESEWEHPGQIRRSDRATTDVDGECLLIRRAEVLSGDWGQYVTE
jgi:hypothetical protein